MRLWTSAKVVLVFALMGGCAQRLFESRFVVDKGDMLLGESASVFSQRVGSYFSNFGMKCSQLANDMGEINCEEVSGQNLFSKIKILIQIDTVTFTVWTLRNVAWGEVVIPAHESGKRIVFDFIGGTKIIEAYTTIDYGEPIPIEIPLK